MKSRWLFAASAAAVSCAGIAHANPSPSIPGAPYEAAPMHVMTTVRNGNMVFDQGFPDLVDGHEMIIFSESEDFSIANNTTLTSARFWTIERTTPGFDGGFQWAIHADAGGTPGGLIYSGSVGLSRVVTGRTVSDLFEVENTFSFPAGIDLTPGGYYLVLHASNDCGTRDEVYWETSASGTGPVGQAQSNCVDPYFAGFAQLAFQLFGKPTCLKGEINDCNGNCAPAGWVGDGICDDGSYSHNGVPIYFNCEQFDNDGGDCDPPICTAPPVPSNPIPFDGATDVASNTILTWNNLERPAAFDAPDTIILNADPAPVPSAGNFENAGEFGPTRLPPMRGLSDFLFGDGGPNFGFGNEMTNWNQAEDFTLAQDSNVQFVRFWTLEFGEWDGQCQISFYSDGGGVPGSLFFASAGSLVSRTGVKGGFEYVFEIPGGAIVPAGTNWIGLHMSGDCVTRDEVYWAGSNGGFGAGGHEFFECGGGANANGSQHAFELYGESVCGVVYDVYTRRLPDGNYQLICSNVPTPQCNAGLLGCESRYEWVVIAKSALDGGQTQGPFWTFTTPVCCCPGDADGNRVVNFADITEVLTFWGFTCP
jgi:hypothetical protein